MRNTTPVFLSLALALTSACSSSPSSTDGTPLFIVAGQSNALGNVRLSGLEAIRDALPGHSSALSATERDAARAGYREGVGDWCNPDEDYSDEAADASIDALREGGLDLSGITAEYTVSKTSMAAYRWRYQQASDALPDPYESNEPSPHPAHTTQIVPFGVGAGVWDDDEVDVLFYGPELGFGMHIEQTKGLDAFHVVKVAMGGSSLFAHWAPNGPLTQQLFQRTDHFLTEQPDASVAGLIWFQGFNDQFDEAPRSAYAANLTTLIEDVRKTYGEALPVVIVQARKVADLAEIADAQQQVADTMSQVEMVESDGLSECFHYDAASQLVIGQRAGATMLRLMD